MNRLDELMEGVLQGDSICASNQSTLQTVTTLTSLEKVKL